MMGAATLNEEIMQERVGEEEDHTQVGYTGCQHVVMALDTPWKIRGRSRMHEFYEELAANWKRPRKKKL